MRLQRSGKAPFRWIDPGGAGRDRGFAFAASSKREGLSLFAIRFDPRDQSETIIRLEDANKAPSPFGRGLGRGLTVAGRPQLIFLSLNAARRPRSTNKRNSFLA